MRRLLLPVRLALSLAYVGCWMTFVAVVASSPFVIGYMLYQAGAHR